MRMIFFLFLFAGVTYSCPVFASSDSLFQQTRQLIESNRFEVEANRAFPIGGQSVDLFSNQGHIQIKDSTATGHLPFFGRGYSLAYGDGGGIEFNNKIEQRKITYRTRKKHKIILYRFVVNGKNDRFDISLQIAENGSCTINVQSNRRSNISYNGQITPLIPSKNNP